MIFYISETFHPLKLRADLFKLQIVELLAYIQSPFFTQPNSTVSKVHNSLQNSRNSPKQTKLTQRMLLNAT